MPGQGDSINLVPLLDSDESQNKKCQNLEEKLSHESLFPALGWFVGRRQLLFPSTEWGLGVV